MTSTSELINEATGAAGSNQAPPMNTSMPKINPLLIREEHQNVDGGNSVQHTIVVHQNNASQPNLMKTTDQA